MGQERVHEYCTRNERNWLVWMKAVVWKLRGIRRGMDKGSCPQCIRNKDANHRCAETKKWRTELL
jgi:hypothetical protein